MNRTKLQMQTKPISKRLKIIHLNFQNTEVVRGFKCSNVVHFITVQKQLSRIVVHRGKLYVLKIQMDYL